MQQVGKALDQIYSIPQGGLQKYLLQISWQSIQRRISEDISDWTNIVGQSNLPTDQTSEDLCGQCGWTCLFDLRQW